MKSVVAVDDENQWRYHNEISPIYLNYVCILNGHYPVPILDGFNYCELGCGLGVTINGLAELYPKGQFVGVDNNDQHIASAEAMAEGIGGANINFRCLEFNDLSTVDFPNFDFIILHDIYSWIDQNTRDGVLRFVNLHLKENGIVFVNYEAMPGSSIVASLRDTVSIHTGDIKADNFVKAQSGLDYLESLAEKRSTFFMDNPAAEQWLNEIKDNHIEVVAQRLLSEPFNPYFFNQVSKEMQGIGLAFSGSAILHLNFIDLAVSIDFQESLKTVKSREEFESRGDFIRNQIFRQDVFVKKSKSMVQEEALEAFSEIVFGTTCTAGEFQPEAVFGDVVLNYENDIFKYVIDNLSAGPQSAVSLVEASGPDHYSIDLILDALKFLTSSGQVMPFTSIDYPSMGSELIADRYIFTMQSNVEYLRNRLFKQERIDLVCSRAAIGIELSMSDALFTLCIAEASKDQVIDWIMQRLIEANQEILIDGGNETETITAGFEDYCQKRLPKLLQLGILTAVDN